MATLNASIADPAANILTRMVSPESPGLRNEVAQFFLSLDFSDAEKDRAAALAERSNANELTDKEIRELDGLVRVDALLSLLHSKARTALRAANHDA